MGGILGYAAGPFRVAGAYGVTDKTGTMVDDLEVYNLGLEWKVGPFSVLGIYEESSYSNRKQKLFMIPVSFKMGAGTFKAQYSKADGSTDLYSAQSFGLGYIYDMSKRTALYAHYGQVDNEGNAATGARFTASGSGPTQTRGGETSRGYEFGIRHFF
jgi:predicted porin